MSTKIGKLDSSNSIMTHQINTTAVQPCCNEYFFNNRPYQPILPRNLTLRIGRWTKVNRLFQIDCLVSDVKTKLATSIILGNIHGLMIQGKMTLQLYRWRKLKSRAKEQNQQYLQNMMDMSSPPAKIPCSKASESIVNHLVFTKLLAAFLKQSKQMGPRQGWCLESWETSF